MGSLREFQDLMKRIYYERDSRRGPYKTVLWLVSEVGEFSTALIRFNKAELESEAADVLAWLCSACNLLEINLEEAAFKKYGGECPKCHSLPCICKENI
ncbi:nucleotide pyrophosphohydrolase [Candidatus Bathyarchaeota archaeon]|nr:nucleotide pyrophosphohydrolase [Candidatus Bathyarchaeota archaeon]